MIKPRLQLAFALSLLLPAIGCGNPPSAAATARDPQPATLRVMTYNIHIGQGMDKRFDLPRIANIIKAANVDVVAVQEVDVKARRSGNVDELAELARLTGMHGVFGKAIDHDGGEYGQAVLSRRPIQRLDVHPLPGDGVQEHRVALFATIPQPKPLPDLLFVGTHLHVRGEDYRLPQAAEINRLLAEHITRPEPAVLLLGDFNSTPEGKVMTFLRERWQDTGDPGELTSPAEKPVRTIDYILLPKGHRWEVVSSTVLDEPVASDHRPVVVELRWKGE